MSSDAPIKRPAEWRGRLDAPAVLALNAASVTETSPLDAEALAALLDTAFHVGAVARGEDAILIALDQDSAHDGINFSWFRDRYPRFVYVDRIVVAADARGRGLARRLYEELFAAARAAAQDWIACEVNHEPPNPGSDAFHAALGFEEVGRAALPGGAKTVRYLMKAL